MLSNDLPVTTLVAWLLLSHTVPALAFQVALPASRQIGLVRTTTAISGRTGTKLFDEKTLPIKTVLRQSRDWIDEVEYVEDDEVESKGPPIRPDMKYLPRNVMRQHKNFVAIREAGGKELTNDVYIREPNSEVCWFVGKVARVSDVTVEQAISRQWALIETHGSNLRPIELFPSRGSLEIWCAPGDSEMQVAYNDPDLVFTQMKREVEGAEDIRNALIGFQGELYERGEEGFRTWRTEEGRAARPPVQSPNQDDELQAPTDDDMKKIEEMIAGKNLNELYKEQQRREGNPVDD
eukprot:scaffold10377_cov150-Amphora_coffeaeformis.AAC.3